MIGKLWNIHKEIAKSLGNNEFNDDSIMDIINDSYNIMFFSITKFCFFKDCKTTGIEKYFYTGINFNVGNKIEENILSTIGIISLDNLVTLLEEYHIEFKRHIYTFENGEIVRKKSKIIVKGEGSFYTPGIITKYIVKKTIENALGSGINLQNLKILDFGCGTGRFTIDVINYLNSEYNIPYNLIIKNNVYAVDIDQIALDITKLKLLLFFNKEERASILEDISKKIIKQNMLILSQFDNQISFKNLGINVIISNPPYFQLKVNESKSMNEIEKKMNEALKSRILQEVEYFRQCGEYRYSIGGMLNYYKLSLEKMMQILPEGGHIGIICPSTLFGDKNCTSLRKYFLLNNKVSEINYYEEGAGLFEGVAQSTVVFFARKGGKSDSIIIGIGEKSFIITLDTIYGVMGNNYEVPYIDSTGWNILKKMNNFPKIREIQRIRNKRGELDLTLFKGYIINKDTGYNLIRGINISEGGIKYEDINEYVNIDSFKEQKSIEYLQNDFGRKRLICKQISNIDLEKRLHFVICNENDILGNSCNYLSLSDQNKLKGLQTILNSYILNWRFKIASSNNHINNYELDELPINIDLVNQDINGTEIEINLKICKAYGLTVEECIYILKSFFTQECIEYVQKNYL